MIDFERCESLYWVFTHRCNDRCPHCYNDSGPHGESLPLDECLAIVENLPRQTDRLILSGGEPLMELEKLLAILDAAKSKYGDRTQLMLQTNGDWLSAFVLDRLLAHGISRIDVASMDRHHRGAGRRREELEALFRSRGLSGDALEPLVSQDDYVQPDRPSYGFWGSTEELWLGGNWPRGRAFETGRWTRNGDHNFCAILSGGKGFLGGTDLPHEIVLQLWKVFPCCPGTRRPLGDARSERVAAVLARTARSPVFRKINEGNPYAMGESLGFSAEHGRARARALGSVCLWCDELLSEHARCEPRGPED